MSREMATPRLVYDDDCGFCKYCVRWFLRFGEFEPVGFAELTPDQKARLPAEYDNCMHLLTDDAVYSCGEGAEQCLARCGSLARAGVAVARMLPYWPRIRERGYRFVADRRAIWGRYRSCPGIE
jgi:predicted DCC family thiol-disulfide oxidoreductase YuxK